MQTTRLLLAGAFLLLQGCGGGEAEQFVNPEQGLGTGTFLTIINGEPVRLSDIRIERFRNGEQAGIWLEGCDCLGSCSYGLQAGESETIPIKNGDQYMIHVEWTDCTSADYDIIVLVGPWEITAFRSDGAVRGTH